MAVQEKKNITSSKAGQISPDVDFTLWGGLKGWEMKFYLDRTYVSKYHEVETTECWVDRK